MPRNKHRISIATEYESCRHKLVLMGNAAVGKTSLIMRTVKNEFDPSQNVTIGAAFLIHALRFGDEVVEFEVWDTAGQERFHSLAPLYYRGCHAALLVYDIQDRKSFDRVKDLVDELFKKVSPNVVIAIAGNKSDMNENRAVYYEEANEYAQENGLIFMETSARNACNVDEIFLAIAKKLPKLEKPIDPTKNWEDRRPSGACC